MAVKENNSDLSFREQIAYQLWDSSSWTMGDTFSGIEIKAAGKKFICRKLTDTERKREDKSEYIDGNCILFFVGWKLEAVKSPCEANGTTQGWKARLIANSKKLYSVFLGAVDPDTERVESVVRSEGVKVFDDKDKSHLMRLIAQRSAGTKQNAFVNPSESAAEKPSGKAGGNDVRKDPAYPGLPADVAAKEFNLPAFLATDYGKACSEIINMTFRIPKAEEEVTFDGETCPLSQIPVELNRENAISVRDKAGRRVIVSRLGFRYSFGYSEAIPETKSLLGKSAYDFKVSDFEQVTKKIYDEVNRRDSSDESEKDTGRRAGRHSELTVENPVYSGNIADNP